MLNKKSITGVFKRSEVVIAFVVVALTTIVTIYNPKFLSPINMSSMLNYISFTGMIAIPMVFLLVAKVMDLSVGAVTGFLSAILAILCKNLGFSPLLSVLIILVLGAVIGFINSYLIVNIKINSFIATIAMMYLYRGLMQVVMGGRNIGELPKKLITPSSIEFLGLNLNVYVYIIIIFIGWFFLQKTAFGKNVYIIGNNEEIATTSGINYKQTMSLLYTVTGITCAICAYFITIQYRVASIVTGVGWEFEVISGCMLGGCSMYGGKGTIAGGVLGIAFMTLLRYSLQTFNIDSGYQIVITGFVLTISVLIDTIRAKKLVA